MPNQNYLGHMERWLKHDKYRHLSECPDGFVDPWNVFRSEPSTRNVTDPRTEEFVRDLARQYTPLFRSTRINIGYDEPWEFAKGASKEIAKRIGADTLFYNSIHAVNEICKQLGKKSYMWADIALKYPEQMRTLSDDIGLCLWGYEADHPFEKEIQTVYANRAKLDDVFLCCGTSNWHSVAGRLRNAEKNITTAVDLCAEYSLEGVILTEWGDDGHFQQHSFLFFPLILFAQYGWRRTIDGEAAADSGQTADSQKEEHRVELGRWIDHYLSADHSHRLSDILHTLATITERYQFDLINASVLFCMLLGDSYPYYRYTVSAIQRPSL